MIILVDRPKSGVPFAKAEGYLKASLTKLKTESPDNAKVLIEYVEAHDKKVEILCAEEPGAFGPFCDEWALLGPCIIWSATLKFKCKAGTISGYRPTGAPILQGKKADTLYGPEITLIHELGHFKQWIENPAIFPSRGAGSTITAGTKETKEIEADNLRRHENPVCKEMGLPQRLNYGDFDGFV